jgi:hypothetical protein
MHFIGTVRVKNGQSTMNTGENVFPSGGMPLEKKYRQVQGLQSQNLCKKGNSTDGKAGISVKMAVRRFSLPEFPENLKLQRCTKPDFENSGFAMLQHVNIFKIQACARFHTPFSAEFSQVDAFTRHFFLNIDRFAGSPVIFPAMLAFEMIFTVFFAENRRGDFSLRYY